MIDRISGCADSTTDESKRENASGSGKRSRNESGKYSDAIENSEFSILVCCSEKVTVIDVSKPRVTLVVVECEKSCRRWTIGKFVSDNSIFLWSRMSVAKFNK